MSRCPAALFMAALAFSSCQEAGERSARSPIFVQEEQQRDTTELYDLYEIQESGTIIAGTLSGPDTYYEYHGRWMGAQYELAQDFASSMGVTLRMEVAADTASLLDKLEKGEVDFVALEMPRWVVRKDAAQLHDAIEQWWDPGRKERLMTALPEGERRVRRNARPVMKDLAHGIISQYDDLFVHYSKTVGWDWRLLAAQCYQESGFDPRAVSWVGAKGLMQIMPSTAAHLGLPAEHIFDEERNIAAGARYLREVQGGFSDIGDPLQRISFTLAAYNGGSHHVRDAMALTEKHGGNPHRWDEVKCYVLRLAEAAYYRDPVVKHGYMRGSETVGYVDQIVSRWNEYRNYARSSTGGSVPAPAKRSVKDGEFRTRVKSAEEWVGDSVF